jgi:AraC family transcriptional regulator, transcriptional activator of pobA
MKEIPTHRFMQMDSAFAFMPLKDVLQMSKGNKNRPHRHNYYEVFLFTKGGGNHMIDFKEYPIKTNSMHFISPGMVHSIKRKASCVGAVITFTHELFAMHQQQNTLFQINLYHNHQFAPIIECSSAEMRFFISLINQVETECETRNPFRNTLVLSCITSLLIQANRKFTAQHQLQLPRLFADERVQAFKNLLDKPFTEKPTVSSLASQLNITAKQLTVLVKKNTGLMPTEHITNQLLVEAKRLLVNTDNTIKEIAFALYFEDPAYFGRFFRKHIGQTPLHFRESMRKKYQT